MESLRKILLDLLLNSIHVSVACSTRRLAWSTGLLPPSRLHLFFIFSLFSLFFLDAIVKKLFLHFTSSSFKVAKVSFSTRFHYFFLWVDDVKIKRSKKYFENEKEIDKKRKRGIRSFNKKEMNIVSISRAHAVALLLEGIEFVDWSSFFQFWWWCSYWLLHVLSLLLFPLFFVSFLLFSHIFSSRCHLSFPFFYFIFT